MAIEIYKRNDIRLIPYLVFKSIYPMISTIVIFLIIKHTFNINEVSIIINVLILIYVCRKVTIIFNSWFNFKYRITSNHLFIKEGFFFPRENAISLNKIQNISLSSNFFMKIMKTSALIIDTGGVNNSNESNIIKIEMILDSELKKLIKIIDISNLNTEVLKTIEKNEEEYIYKISNKHILLVSFFSFSYMLSIPILLSLFSKFNDNETINEFFKDLLDSPIKAILTMFLLLFIALVYGFGITYLKLGNFFLYNEKIRFSIKKGVFNTDKEYYYKEKILSLKVRQTIIMNLLKLKEYKIITGGDFKDPDIQSKSSSLIFPLIKVGEDEKLLSQFLPSFYSNVSMKESASVIIFVTSNIGLLLFNILLLILLVGYLKINLLIKSVLTILSIYIFFRHVCTRYSKLSLDEDILKVQLGIYSKTSFVLLKDNIEELSIYQNSLQKKIGYYKLSMVIRLNPIKKVRIKCINQKNAQLIYDWYTQINPDESI